MIKNGSSSFYPFLLPGSPIQQWKRETNTRARCVKGLIAIAGFWLYSSTGTCTLWVRSLYTCLTSRAPTQNPPVWGANQWKENWRPIFIPTLLCDAVGANPGSNPDNSHLHPLLFRTSGQNKRSIIVAILCTLWKTKMLYALYISLSGAQLGFTEGGFGGG